MVYSSPYETSWSNEPPLSPTHGPGSGAVDQLGAAVAPRGAPSDGGGAANPWATTSSHVSSLYHSSHPTHNHLPVGDVNQHALGTADGLLSTQYGEWTSQPSDYMVGVETLATAPYRHHASVAPSQLHQFQQPTHLPLQHLASPISLVGEGHQASGLPSSFQATPTPPRASVQHINVSTNHGYSPSQPAAQSHLPSPTTPSFQPPSPYTPYGGLQQVPPPPSSTQAFSKQSLYYDDEITPTTSFPGDLSFTPNIGSQSTMSSSQHPGEDSTPAAYEFAWDPTLEGFPSYLDPSTSSSIANFAGNAAASSSSGTGSGAAGSPSSGYSHSPRLSSSIAPSSLSQSTCAGADHPSPSGLYTQSSSVSSASLYSRPPPRSMSFPHLGYAGGTTTSSPASSTFPSPSYQQAVPLPPSAFENTSRAPHLRTQSHSDVRRLSLHSPFQGHALQLSPFAKAVSRRGSEESLWSEDGYGGTGAPSPSGARTPVEWHNSFEGLNLGLALSVAMGDESAAQVAAKAKKQEAAQAGADRAALETVPGDFPEAAVRRYLQESNRLMLGERTVLVLSPKIAQRSYGTEKRFLCPQPMALLLGASWWSNIENRGRKNSGQTSSARTNEPPSVFVTMSSDPAPTITSEPSSVEWMANDGSQVVEQEEDELILSGRAIGKSNFVSTAPAVHAVVTVVAPGTAPRDERVIGTFPGKPMSIISKPSKRRQAATSSMTLQHGGLVSLYNRTKAQSGSTRFLGVSGTTSSFPAIDWRAMTGDQVRPYAPQDVYSTTFVARTGSWDPFVIYAVDLSLPAVDPQILPAPAPYPGFPRPPVNAIAFDAENPVTLYYNMPIVLQCLATAVVSPVMIIRKIDTKSTAIGGGSLDGYTPKQSSHLPCAQGERLGEPVTQFRPMALEVYSLKPGQQPPNAFLACLGDNIGINQSRENRVPVPSPQPSFLPPKSPVTPPPVLPLTPTSDSGSASQLPVVPGPQTPHLGSLGAESDGQDAFYGEDQSSNGAKVKKLRRLSSASSIHLPYPSASSATIARPPGTLSKHKRRGVSLSSLTTISTEGLGGVDAPLRWTIDCGEACVWTIAGIDLNRHTFYIPPDALGSKHPSTHSAPPSADPLFTVPVPAVPIRTAIPTVTDFDPPAAGTVVANGTAEDNMISIFGDNFSDNYRIWLGTSPCLNQIVKTPQRVLVTPPPRDPNATSPASLRISLVRNDGVVFPSGIFYREAHST